jgi:hypothetical protein
MNERVNELLNRIGELQEQLEQEWEAGRGRFHYHLERQRVRFEQQVIAAHLALRTSLPSFLGGAALRDFVMAPVIYSMIVPLLLLDLCLFLYQHLYFRAYRIPRARRSDYLVLDRGQLAYLNGIEKLNCYYCSYANGLFALAREVGARTEQYWCPIKHARRLRDNHSRYNQFFEYGDAEAYRQELQELRGRLEAEERRLRDGG